MCRLTALSARSPNQSWFVSHGTQLTTNAIPMAPFAIVGMCVHTLSLLSEAA
jgi:hypothetical protein